MDEFKHLEYLSIVSKLGAMVLDTCGQILFKSSLYGEMEEFITLLHEKLDCEERCRIAFLYACYQARRFGGRYIFYAPSGFVYCASPLLDTKGNLSSGVLLGPFVLTDYEDFFEFDLGEKVTESEKDELRKNINVIPYRSTKEAHGVSEHLHYVTARFFSRFETVESVSKQSDFLTTSYPLEMENELFDFSDSKHTDIIYRGVEYIKKNYAQKLTLKEMAEHLFISQSYFCRIFKDGTGQTLGEYIAYIRIEESKKLLANQSIDIVDIPERVGFESQSYFTRVFKKKTGTTPARYRRENVRVII